MSDETPIDYHTSLVRESLRVGQRAEGPEVKESGDEDQDRLERANEGILNVVLYSGLVRQ